MERKLFNTCDHIIDDPSQFKEAEKSLCIIFEPDDARNLYLSLTSMWTHGSTSSTFFPTYVFYPATPELLFFKLHHQKFKTTKFLYYKTHLDLSSESLQCKEKIIYPPIRNVDDLGINHIRNYYLKKILNRDSMNRLRPSFMWPDRRTSKWIYDIRNASLENPDRENCHHIILQPGFDTDLIKEGEVLQEYCSGIAKTITFTKGKCFSVKGKENPLYTVNLNEFTDYTEMIIQLISSAKMYVGIDCWISHLAITLGVPSIVLIKKDEVQKYSYSNDYIHYINYPAAFEKQYFDKINYVACQIAAGGRPKRK